MTFVRRTLGPPGSSRVFSVGNPKIILACATTPRAGWLGHKECTSCCPNPPKLKFRPPLALGRAALTPTRLRARQFGETGPRPAKQRQRRKTTPSWSWPRGQSAITNSPTGHPRRRLDPSGPSNSQMPAPHQPAIAREPKRLAGRLRAKSQGNATKSSIDQFGCQQETRIVFSSLSPGLACVGPPIGGRKGNVPCIQA